MQRFASRRTGQFPPGVTTEVITSGDFSDNEDYNVIMKESNDCIQKSVLTTRLKTTPSHVVKQPPTVVPPVTTPSLAPAPPAPSSMAPAAFTLPSVTASFTAPVVSALAPQAPAEPPMYVSTPFIIPPVMTPSSVPSSMPMPPIQTQTPYYAPSSVPPALFDSHPPSSYYNAYSIPSSIPQPVPVYETLEPTYYHHSSVPSSAPVVAQTETSIPTQATRPIFVSDHMMPPSSTTASSTPAWFEL